MKLFPAIDLREGQVVRLHQGQYDQQKIYGNNPLDQAKIFADAGSTWLHVIDLDGARNGDLTHLSIIEEICTKTNLKVEVGGGVRNEQVIDALLNAGVTRAIMGTAALQQWDWFKELVASKKYQQKIVLGLDARHGKVAVAGWETQLEKTALEIAQEVSDWHLAAIVYTDIATDGTLQGPNVEATAEIANATNVPVVASGGIGTLAHLEALKPLKIQGSIVGRALYENAFTIDEAIKTFEG